MTFSISYDRSGVDDRQVIRKWTFGSNDHNSVLYFRPDLSSGFVIQNSPGETGHLPLGPSLSPMTGVELVISQVRNWKFSIIDPKVPYF